MPFFAKATRRVFSENGKEEAVSAENQPVDLAGK